MLSCSMYSLIIIKQTCIFSVWESSDNNKSTFLLQEFLAIVLVSERRSISIVPHVIFRLSNIYIQLQYCTYVQYEMTNVNDEMTDVIIILILY